MPIGVRRQGRMLALQVLYEYDTTQHRVEEVLARRAGERHLPEDVRDFARELVQGVLGHLQGIDQKIEQAVPNEWPLEQMAKIDKNVLRLAIYEILFNNTVPAKGAINEAVELAKTFGSEHSGQFVNGVLGTILSQHKAHRHPVRRRGEKG